MGVGSVYTPTSVLLSLRISKVKATWRPPDPTLKRIIEKEWRRTGLGLLLLLFMT